MSGFGCDLAGGQADVTFAPEDTQVFDIYAATEMGPGCTR
jgi:hypothetical protein